MFKIVHQHPLPVLSRASNGAETNKYGFEGGRVIKLGSTYHLFISEMIDDPKWAKTRLAHWTSEDLLFWQRVSTLFESSGAYEGNDPRAALFLPQPVFDDTAGRWNVFYSAFRCKPNEPGRWLLNHEGRAWQAVSRVLGDAGVGGPYDNVGVVLEPFNASQSWEGLQGVDFFSPFRAMDGSWLAFYGSAQTQNWPCKFWGVGLAEAANLSGPWRRRAEGNPVLIDPVWVENPVVHRVEDGRYAALYDATPKGRVIGITTSTDGVHWSAGQLLPLSAGAGDWLKQPRTPLCLIPHAGSKHEYDVLFTGNDREGYGCIGWCIVRDED